MAPFGKVAITVPADAGAVVWSYDGRCYGPGETFFVLKAHENCFEKPKLETAKKSCWPWLCKKTNGAFHVEEPDQVHIAVGETVKVTVPVHPDPDCGKPGMVVFQPMCAGCFAVSVGDVAKTMAAEGDEITDGSAPLSNPTSLFLGNSCDTDQVDCLWIENLSDAALPINILWGSA